MSELELWFAQQCCMVNLEPRWQFRPWPGDRRSFDFAWPDHRLLVEIQGGKHVRGRRSHTGSDGYENDCRKAAQAVAEGWRVIWITKSMLADESGLRAVQGALTEKSHDTKG